MGVWSVAGGTGEEGRQWKISLRSKTFLHSFGESISLAQQAYFQQSQSATRGTVKSVNFSLEFRLYLFICQLFWACKNKEENNLPSWTLWPCYFWHWTCNFGCPDHEPSGYYCLSVFFEIWGVSLSTSSSPTSGSRSLSIFLVQNRTDIKLSMSWSTTHQSWNLDIVSLKNILVFFHANLNKQKK